MAAPLQGADKYTKATIKTIEMPEGMANDVQDYAVKAIQEFKSENDIANAIKKYMDSQHTPTWNVMCGRSFGAYVTHESKRYIYFSVGHLSILCWKCG
jgi:dynein light chain LC8-type